MSKSSVEHANEPDDYQTNKYQDIDTKSKSVHKSSICTKHWKPGKIPNTGPSLWSIVLLYYLYDRLNMIWLLRGRHRGTYGKLIYIVLFFFWLVGVHCKPSFRWLHCINKHTMIIRHDKLALFLKIIYGHLNQVTWKLNILAQKRDGIGIKVYL